jgi:hypothetical protein
VRLLGTAEGLRETQGGFRITQHTVAETRSNARAILGPEGFDAELAEGRALTPDQALRYAVEHLGAV